ncbi:EscU/YscU/HrcU family type III secretion system export apparatus switch protein [Pseudorhodoferax sp.]|uniref:EscU/YscU/HrcU family type III secretion system export apparatus switch protein n=1 Tax=Pseudorhodoferax sp. TaxID=1993553 RepID=UPI002DD6532F|nr:flagellar type III secretion system protein FlhB [Pseudorhodoferax sp.]
MEQGASSADKSEKATPHKLRKVRQQGQAARSKDAVMAVGIAASLSLAFWLAPGWAHDLRRLFGWGLVDLNGTGALEDAWSTLFRDAAWLTVRMVAPLLLVPVLLLLASLLPGGWAASAENLQPKLERLNPVSNLGRLFSGKHVAGVAASIGKALLLCAVLWFLCTGSAQEFLRLQSLPLSDAIAQGAGLLMSGVVAMVLVFVLFALIDLPVQVFFFLRNQRMSKHDVKEEHKTTEGRPEVKSRIRQLQLQMARRGLNKTVPQADVVIVNPEHYAVALKYDEARAQAPFVLAKGVDEMALYIRQLARTHGVEVVSQPPLARAIYKTSQVQQQIPVALYAAVALVLNYVLQLKAFQAGRRPHPPGLPQQLPIPDSLGTP